MVTRKRLFAMAGCERPRSERGQDLAEAALVLPILVVLILGIIQFGLLVFNYNSISNMAREGARYASINPPGADSGNPGPTCPNPLPTSATSILSAACQFATGIQPNLVTVETQRVAKGGTGCLGQAGCVKITVRYNAQLFFWLPGVVAQNLTMTSASIMERER